MNKPIAAPTLAGKRMQKMEANEHSITWCLRYGQYGAYLQKTFNPVYGETVATTSGIRYVVSVKIEDVEIWSRDHTSMARVLNWLHDKLVALKRDAEKLPA